MFKRIFSCFLILCLLCSIPAFAEDSTYSMKTSEAGIEFIKYFEGFRSTVYSDSSGYAIGYGTHCNPSDFPGAITEEQADEMVRGVLSGMEAKVNSMAEKIGITLTQNQFDALISLTYNLGSGWMNSGYRLYNMLSSGIGYYSDDEIINTFGRYCHIGTEISNQLAQRRLAEAKIFLYSDYKTGGTQNYEYEIIDDPEAETDIVFKAKSCLTICKFSDIKYTNWFYKYLSPLSLVGVIAGYGDGSFRPNGCVTCGEALKLILLAAGYDSQAATGDHWASGYLKFAEDNYIIPAGTIENLDAPASRALVAEIAANATGLATSSAASPFADTSDGYVLALYVAGVVTGSCNETGMLVYKPDASMARSEICAIVWRIMTCQG